MDQSFGKAHLEIDTEYYNALDIRSFALMLKDPSFCYKFYWSFVMNDELWNLMPMDSSLNSAKSNRLPQWDPFFDRFSENQFILYQLIQELPGIHKLYEGCWRDNLHSIWAGQELYRPAFTMILHNNMRPVYDSARRQGYEIWKIPG